MPSISVKRKRRAGKQDRLYTAIIKFGRYGPEFSRGTGKTSEREAKIRAREIARDIETKELPIRYQEHITVSALFGYWWTKHGHKQRSAYDMELRAKTLIEILGEGTFVRDIDDDRASELVTELYEGPRGDRSAATVNRYISILSKALSIGKKHKTWKVGKGDQFRPIDWDEHKQKEPKERRIFLSPVEARKLASLAPKHISLAILWSIYTGCRLNETKTLTHSKVYRDAEYCEVFAKGGFYRPVLLSALAMKIIDAANESNPGSEYIFNLTNRRRHWLAARAKLGKPEFRWHDLRHVAGTWLRQYGSLDLKAIGRALGHANVETTNRYAHVADTELLTAFNAMPDIMDGVQTPLQT